MIQDIDCLQESLFFYLEFNGSFNNSFGHSLFFGITKVYMTFVYSPSRIEIFEANILRKIVCLGNGSVVAKRRKAREVEIKFSFVVSAITTPTHPFIVFTYQARSNTHALIYLPAERRKS